ncbi:hypothetical protein TL16_g10543 [Triparma laevis f. inornata]|uniref:Uncharacterized protein n=2 Tax=Triparma laevis TaxID=1534972 RepID=A0A9W7ACB3_9STRA|nr:hypothetical protein TrLO_g12758 [Triparma laevis f. longispina]GMH86442.1 hypothetical protein TL16_g10543 [Triparma laevis f. inornata]
MASLTQTIKPEHSQLDAKSPLNLKSQGNDALNKGDFITAGRMYTLAIDLILDGRDNEAIVKPGVLSMLDKESGHVLHALFSNRSLAMLKQKDVAAAKEDAELCTLAKPDFAKGHLRLLAALDEDGASVEERRSVVSRALLSCPENAELKTMELRYALDTDGGVSASTDIDGAAVIRETMKVAAEQGHPQRAMACGDVGSAYACGAHGLEKDVVKAESFLKQGMELGDGASARNLGLLYLDLQRVNEAAPTLSKAAELGDEEANDILQQIAGEAEKKKEEMIKKLRMMADMGDQRAVEMIREFDQQ